MNLSEFDAERIRASLEESHAIGRTVYQGFNERKLDLWDDVIDSDVVIRSTVGSQPMHGLDALKAWGAEFPKAFDARLDLVDEIYSINRAAIAVNINWRHNNKFFDLEPTGRVGTSVEYFILWIAGGKVNQFWVADHTLDLTSYLTHERGMHYPQYFTPEPIIKGYDPLE